MEQRLMTKEEMAAAFEKAGADDRNNSRREKARAAARSLSLAVAALRDFGLPVELEMHEWPNDLAFFLVNPGQNCAVPYVGFLTCGATQHLVAIAMSVGEEVGTKIFVSEYDVRYLNMSKKEAISRKIYDFEKDPEAITSFQNFILMLGARRRNLMDADVCGVFSGNKKPAKRAILPPGLPPRQG